MKNQVLPIPAHTKKNQYLKISKKQYNYQEIINFSLTEKDKNYKRIMSCSYLIVIIYKTQNMRRTYTEHTEKHQTKRKNYLEIF